MKKAVLRSEGAVTYVRQPLDAVQIGLFESAGRKVEVLRKLDPTEGHCMTLEMQKAASRKMAEFRAKGSKSIH